MSDPTITCPHCKSSIKLTDSLAAPLLSAKEAEFERRLAAQAKQFEERSLELKQREEVLAKQQASLDEQVAQRLAQERKTLADQAFKRAQLSIAADLDAKERALADLQEALRLNNEKLADAQKAQAEVLRKERELEERNDDGIEEQQEHEDDNRERDYSQYQW